MQAHRFATGLLIAIVLSAAGCALTPSVSPQQRLSIERKVVLPERVSETSGLAEHDGLLWTHNDSGDGPYLYAISPESGEIVLQKTLQDALNFDWEELAADTQYLHVFDCGNNAGRREWLQIYSVRWGDLVRHSYLEVPARLTEFSFADAEPTAGAYDHDNDCEAAAMVEGELWVFTKNWQNQQTRMYVLSPDGGRHALVSRQTFPAGGLITAADYDPARKQLALLGYTRNRFSSSTFLWLVPVVNHEPDWSAASRHSISPAGQWEAVIWRPEGLLMTRESSLLGRGALGFISLP